MKYRIRKAEKKDISNIIDLAVNMMAQSRSPYRQIDEKELHDYRRKDLQILYDTYKNDSVGLFVAESLEGEFLGHVISMANSVESSTGELRGYVFDLSIKPEHQGLGIGKNLMDLVEEYCKARGMKYMCLNVTSSNSKAVGFYERIGYEEERKRMVKVIEYNSDETDGKKKDNENQREEQD
ncbi:MAG: GNAT family N-acetyltransferase [Vulcanimicrobiota bacterium]